MVYAKILLFIIISIWSYQLTINHSQWLFLDNANLIFHEAGHFIFFFTPNTFQLLAGTLMQLAIPLICLISFYRQSQFFSVSFCLFWFGESLNNVGIYISDAATMNLNLIGGLHDWNTLFTQYNLLDQTNFIGTFVQYLSTLIILAGLSLMFTLITKTVISTRAHSP
jgi:hypothetical protein